jgi:phasin family protein
MAGRNSRTKLAEPIINTWLRNKAPGLSIFSLTNWTESLLTRILWGAKMADASAKKSGFVALNRANNGLQFSGPEVESMFASQRKNVEAMMQANRLALDGVQAVWRRQLDFIQEAVEGLTTLVGDFPAPPGPLNEKVAKHAEYSKRAFERNLANVGELTELATKAASDAMNIINQRFCEGLGEVGRTREKRTGETTSS